MNGFLLREVIYGGGGGGGGEEEKEGMRVFMSGFL
jgi:hypothetical protein